MKILWFSEPSYCFTDILKQIYFENVFFFSLGWPCMIVSFLSVIRVLWIGEAIILFTLSARENIYFVIHLTIIKKLANEWHVLNIIIIRSNPHVLQLFCTFFMFYVSMVLFSYEMNVRMVSFSSFVLFFFHFWNK